jgi:RAB6A-GEF complex partner protein 1
MYWPTGAPQIFAYSGDDPGEQARHSLEGDAESDTHKNAIENGGSAAILDLRTARHDHMFATITRARLDLWAVRPVVVLASVSRSEKSLETYGSNAGVIFKPDGSTLVVRTSSSYLMLYSVEAEGNARVLQQQYGYSQNKRQIVLRNFGIDDTAGVPEVLLRFRRAIKIDAGIESVNALDSELVVATTKPAAVQCIRWDLQKEGSNALTQTLTKTEWVLQKSTISTMVHDRAMNLSVWLSNNGHAYAVQRSKPQLSRAPSSDESLPSSKGSTSPATRLFDGYCFHKPDGESTAIIASINARFSLIALATSNGRILCYAAKDYAGNIPLSHEITTTISRSTTGSMTCLAWSPDGHCLFVGYERGWTTWSVFGKEGASTFHQNISHADSNRDDWLLTVRRAAWTSGGAEILISTATSNRIWKLEMSRSAAMGCFSCANLVRALLQTPTELSLYRGHELPDLTSISNKASLWHHASYPATYLNNQWPIKSSVVSQDGRYVAVAGRRGLAHYSVQSGRWKMFADPAIESSFAIRGGMCWFGHILAVATEHAGGYDLRLYSRELDLGRFPQHVEPLSTPIVFIGPSGEDSVLVYTYENVLYHYIINITERGAQLVQVGQIAFQGIVRAPSRVRSVSWIVPESQLRNGDPSRDVEFASVLFLVDDKLVLLQSTRNEEDELKYEMRVVAQHVEYYILMRDQIYLNFVSVAEESAPPTPSPGSANNTRRQQNYSMRDSLWIFSGDQLRLWPDVRELFHHGASDLGTQPVLSMPVDFYPLSILLTKGIVLGIESELLQRRGVSFAQFNSSIRTQLFLPYVLRHQLCEAQNTAAAFGLANQYQNLSYFAHALEILLHHVLDDEVDRKRGKSDEDETEPLPAVLSFLQLVLPVATYLATVVQCVRKTELTSWRTLFQHLPPPFTLFEQALELEDLKTASGYLIVLQGLEEGNDESDTYDARKFESYVTRLMMLAREKGDFELCAELARFMMGIDPRGEALKRVIVGVGFRAKNTHLEPGRSVSGVAQTLQLPTRGKSRDQSPGGSSTSTEHEKTTVAGGDYFSASPGGY